MGGELSIGNRQLRLKRVCLNASIGLGKRLDDVSFAVAAGEQVTIIGPSGAGKTSLLRLLNRLADPSQGSIEFEGRDLQQWPVAELRRQVAFVPQTPRLLGMDGQAALRYPLQLQQMPEAVQRQRIHVICQALAMPEHWLARTASDLSLGQQQWVAIARSLTLYPKVLLLDDPLATLDLGQLAKLLTTLRTSCWDETGQPMTVIITDHLPREIVSKGDRYLLLHEGQLLEDRAAADWDQVAMVQWFNQTAQRDAEDWPAADPLP